MRNSPPSGKPVALLSLVFAFVLATLLFGGCEKKASSDGANTASPPDANTAAAPSSPSGPGPGEKSCFACNGSGTVACHAAGCKGGKVDCPAPCLKLSQGNWQRKDVNGHDSNLLWISFRGKSGTTAWSQGHLGQVIVYQNGEPVNIGPCKLCGGSTTATCPSCKGQGTQACDVCAGKKFVLTAWTPTDNPWFNKQPDLIRLKDGTVLLGRIAAKSGDDRTIVTRDKKVVHVNVSNIVVNLGAVSSLAIPAATSK